MIFLKLICDFLSNLKKPKLSEQFFLNSEGLRREISDGTVEELSWSNLKKVVIVTTDEGPYWEDLYFVLDADPGGTIVSHEWATRIHLLNELEKLPGFNWESFIQAMGSTENSSFVCWERQPPI